MGTEVSQLFGRMLIALLQSIALRRAYQSKASRKPTFLFIDECQNYVSASSLEKMLAESRKFGLHLILANQNLAQLESKKLRENLLSNTNVKFVGANSPTTLQKMAKELGIKAQDFERMRSHQFYLRVGQNPARVFRPPAFLLRHKRKYFLKAKEKRTLVKKISQSA